MGETMGGYVKSSSYVSNSWLTVPIQFLKKKAKGVLLSGSYDHKEVLRKVLCFLCSKE